MKVIMIVMFMNDDGEVVVVGLVVGGDVSGG